MERERVSSISPGLPPAIREEGSAASSVHVHAATLLDETSWNDEVELWGFGFPCGRFGGWRSGVVIVMLTASR